jgi:uncharacterized GH25 family protein
MKKIICLVVVLLMIAAVAIAAKKVVITSKNVASLKGTWTGMITFGMAETGGSSPATLEILNDSAPLKAKLTIANMPGPVAMQFGESPGQKVAESDDGVITSAGTVMWTGPTKNFFELTLLDNKKVSVWYFFRGMKGDATLTKK